ncbi:glycosyltransferase family 39 protein [Caldibacillus lycopersici]|uniref:Glycosyltransferase family 39 protein n=1 Tax=Perspicuibacillus lycopersici TaxID=1325689 RepID=A0AAE3IT95_9BACI|nr:glycosyltransferase family 39 protein [Perspicuibacillus lycopersici]
MSGLSGQSGYGAVLGYIYGFFYPNPLWGQYINVLASVLTIIVFYKILCKLTIDQKYKTIGILVVCFMPNYIIMSAILLRESFITLLLALTIYCLLEWFYKYHWKYIIYAISLVLGATYLHSGTFAYAIAIFIVLAFANNKKRKFQFKQSSIFITGFSIIFITFLYSSYGDTLFGYLGGIESVKDVVAKSEVYATGGSAYNVYLVDDSSSLGFIINSPIRIFYFLASPLPWDWRGMSDIIAFFGSGFFYLLAIVYGFRALSLKNNKNKELIIVFLIFIICSGLIYSWGVSNAGTALRHRDKFLASFTLLLIISLDSIKQFKKQKVPVLKVENFQWQ